MIKCHNSVRVVPANAAYRTKGGKKRRHAAEPAIASHDRATAAETTVSVADSILGLRWLCCNNRIGQTRNVAPVEEKLG